MCRKLQILIIKERGSVPNHQEKSQQSYCGIGIINGTFNKNHK